jgi:hypothetical protein
MQDTSVQCYRRFSHCYALLGLLLLVLSTMCSARERKEVIQFTNGDRITCEIIKLEKGYLYVRPLMARGTIEMDWSNVAYIESPQMFLVTDKAGKRYTGSLHSAVVKGKVPEELQVQVTGPSTSQVVAGKELVAIERTDNTFWQNLHGGLSAGLNSSKQEGRTQYNFQSDTTFERTKWAAAANYQSSFSGGGDISDLRNSLGLSVARQLGSDRNFCLGLANFLQSDEQQLDLRTTLGAAVGHMFSYTNNTRIFAFVGADWNNEHYSSEAMADRTGNSAEAVIGTQVNFFRFRTTDIRADARLYPSLTDSGRVRFDFNTSLGVRLASRLFWNFGYYLNVDSRPPQNLPKTDYGTTSGLEWNF